MNKVIAPSQYPFRWHGKDYIIKEAGIKDGKAYAKSELSEPMLKKELIFRIERDKELHVYVGYGFVCFKEDYK